MVTSVSRHGSCLVMGSLVEGGVAVVDLPAVGEAVPGEGAGRVE